MSTTQPPKNRWKGTSYEDRRREMARLNRIKTQRAESRRLAEAIERVQAAGYTLLDMSAQAHMSLEKAS